MHLSAALFCVLPAVSALKSGSACPPTQLSVRLPPYHDHALNASNTTSSGCPPSNTWTAPPTGWFAGTWSIRKTSGTSYLSYGNLQWDLTPAMATCAKNTTTDCPTGSLAGVVNELTTWVPADNKTALNGAIGGGGRKAASVRAYNTPRRLNFPALNSDWDAVYDNTIIAGPGKGYMQTWSVLYWGMDSTHLPYMVVHEDPAHFPTGQIGVQAVHVISINRDGPDEETLTPVLEALKGLGYSELTAQIEKMGATKWDDKLMGGPAICDAECTENQPLQSQ